MRNSMNVNLFKLNTSPGVASLDVLLLYIASLPLEDRVRKVGSFDVRLDHVAAPGTEGNTSSFWMLDFVKMRFDHGPGKVSKGTALEGFTFGRDEGFGEEAAALFDPATHYLAVQYNHHGVRASAMEEYFNLMLANAPGIPGYQLRAKLDSTSSARLANKKFITKISYKVEPDKISPELRNADVSLAQALRMNAQQGGAMMELTIGAKRGDNLLTDMAKSLINTLRQVRQEDVDNGTDALRHFEVYGKEEKIARSDAINMLSPKLEKRIGELSLGPDRRYTLPSRWIALQRVIRGWAEQLT